MNKSKTFLFVKGVLIGFCSLAAPGLSSSTIAIILGFYYDMIYAISHVLKKPKECIPFLGILVSGYGVGALLGAVAVNTLYIKFTVPFVAAILGFLIASIPRAVVDNKENFKHTPDIIIMIAVGAIFLVYSLVITNGESVSFDVIRFPMDYIIMFVVGMITSTTLVVPGVDFEVTLMAMGYYLPFIGLIGSLVKGTLTLGFSVEYFAQLFLMVIYLIGYGVGSFLFSKGLRYLITKFPRQLQSVNLALILVAPVIVIEKCVLTNPDVSLMHISWKQWTWAFIVFAAAYFSYTWVPMLCRYLHIIPQKASTVIAAENQAARKDIPVEEVKQELAAEGISIGKPQETPAEDDIPTLPVDDPFDQK